VELPLSPPHSTFPEISCFPFFASNRLGTESLLTYCPATFSSECCSSVSMAFALLFSRVFSSPSSGTPRPVIRGLSLVASWSAKSPSAARARSVLASRLTRRCIFRVCRVLYLPPFLVVRGVEIDNPRRESFSGHNRPVTIDLRRDYFFACAPRFKEAFSRPGQAMWALISSPLVHRADCPSRLPISFPL